MLLLFSADLSANSWYSCDKDIFYCKTFEIGTFRARIVFEDGTRKYIPKNSVTSYSINGKIFEKIYLIKNGKLSKKYHFMELISSYGHLRIYRVTNNDTPYSTEKLKDKYYYHFLPRVK